MYWKHSNDPLEKEMAELLKKHGRKVAEVEYRPTAEAMALDFLERINEACKPMDVIVKRIKVWETASSYAEAVRED
jgi:6-pyruvoyltetrahydropterin/6-carboxytetrahydropterin synthase